MTLKSLRYKPGQHSEVESCKSSSRRLSLFGCGSLKVMNDLEHDI